MSSSSFNRFYQTWFDKLHNLVDNLKTSPKPPTTPEDNETLLSLATKVMSHYEEYYRVKKLAADTDVLSLFSSPWSTSLERSLHWVAGYRPTTVFHLVYTESSILFESHILDILRGLRTGDLGDLSPNQLSRVSELQCETVREENAISDELSEWQDGASDLVKMRGWSCGGSGGGGGGGGWTNLDQEIGRLVVVVEKADELRLRTIRKVVELLTPQQAVEFLIAAAELQFGVRGWGLNHDGQRGTNT